MMTAFEKAIALFDDYHAADPNSVTVDGATSPASLFYAQKLFDWVQQLEPAASEHLLLAARAQHIGRWKTPRSTYPQGKAGYLNWRKDLAKFHAATAGQLMEQAGYGQKDVEAVQHIILKEDLRTNKQVQAMENGLCLVFLQYQYADFIKEHTDEQVIRILRKTWNKMTEPGRQAALLLPLQGRPLHLVQQALAIQ